MNTRQIQNTGTSSFFKFIINAVLPVTSVFVPEIGAVNLLAQGLVKQLNEYSKEKQKEVDGLKQQLSAMSNTIKEMQLQIKNIQGIK